MDIVLVVLSGGTQLKTEENVLLSSVVRDRYFNRQVNALTVHHTLDQLRARIVGLNAHEFKL